MNKNIILWGIASLALIISVVGLVGNGDQSVPLGGVTNFNSMTLSDNLVVGGTASFTGAPTFTADATFSGGDNGITVTSTNTATSSIIVGCIDSFATSTETEVRLSATSTSPTSGVYAQWVYGSCADL